MTKVELLAALAGQGVQLNEAAKTLFASNQFVTGAQRTGLQTVELTVGQLDLPQGAAWSEICRKADDLGLLFCPLETAAHFRLQFLDQPEGEAVQAGGQHQAPPGSITVASKPLSSDDDFPKGFYLRRTHGVPWLRGYRASADHRWDPKDHLLFCRRSGTRPPTGR